MVRLRIEQTGYTTLYAETYEQAEIMADFIYAAETQDKAEMEELIKENPWLEDEYGFDEDITEDIDRDMEYYGYDITIE